MSKRLKNRLLAIVLVMTASLATAIGSGVITKWRSLAPSLLREAAGQCGGVFEGGGPASQWVFVDSDGNLAYKTMPKGDQIMDFSFAGYFGGGLRIPDVPVQRMVSPSGGDDTSAIQAAINAVSNLEAVSGVRGTVLLEAGTFNCSATLQITSSGVVLRGSGSGANGTNVIMTGQPHTFLTIHGSGSWQTVSGPATITDSYVPFGASSFNVDSASAFNVGDPVLITRPSTNAWVHFMGMDNLIRDGEHQTWVSGSIRTDRVIKAISGNRITLDVPVSDSFDASLLDPPGCSVARYGFPGRISQAGVESLHVVAPAVDADISQAQYEFLSMDTVIDGWARDCRVNDTINSITIGRAGKQLTLDGVKINHSIPHSGSAAPADFSVTGTQILVNRCSSNGEGSWYFVTGSQATGPNVLLNFSVSGHKAIEPHQRWATGLLLDNCQLADAALNLKNRGTDGSGHGWAIGWGVAWNCVANTLVIQEPPGSTNFAIGCTGTRQRASMPGGDGTLLPQGTFDSHGTPVVPSSLYLAQLCQRLGPQALINIGYSGPAAPSITGVEVSGKHLLVSGQGFDAGAVLVVDGVDKKTVRRDSSSLIGKKVAKKIAPGQTVVVQVRNSDGQVSALVMFTQQ